MTKSKYIVSSQDLLPTQQKSRGGGNKIVVGMVVKSKIGELEEGIRTSNKLSGVVQGVSGKKRFLASFQDGFEINISSNQLTTVIVEKIPEEKEPEVSAIPKISEEKVELEKGYYRCVYVTLRFEKEVGVESKEDQADVEDDSHE